MKGFDSHALWMRITLALVIGHLVAFVYGLTVGARITAIWGLAGTLTWSAVTVAFWLKARQGD